MLYVRFFFSLFLLIPSSHFGILLFFTPSTRWRAAAALFVRTYYINGFSLTNLRAEFNLPEWWAEETEKWKKCFTLHIAWRALFQEGRLLLKDTRKFPSKHLEGRKRGKKESYPVSHPPPCARYTARNTRSGKNKQKMHSRWEISIYALF
jgi:hypothetical protein